MADAKVQRAVVPAPGEPKVLRFPHQPGKAPHVLVRTLALFSKLYDESFSLAQEPGRVSKRLEASILIMQATLNVSHVDGSPLAGNPTIMSFIMKFNAMTMVSANPIYANWVPLLSQLETREAFKKILTLEIASTLTLRDAKREYAVTFESDPPPSAASLERFGSLLSRETDDLKAELNSFKMIMLAEFQAVHARNMVQSVVFVRLNVF